MKLFKKLAALLLCAALIIVSVPLSGAFTADALEDSGEIIEATEAVSTPLIDEEPSGEASVISESESSVLYCDHTFAVNTHSAQWYNKYICTDCGTTFADIFSTFGSIISNDYLKFSVTNDNFAMYTTGGDPEISTDNNVRLLYGDIGSGTSLSLVNINGVVYNFHGINTYVNAAGDMIYSYNVYDGVLVQRYCSFVYNIYTQRKDTLEVKFVLTNVSDSAQTAGGKIYFDTMLGGNDHAPFRIPGEGDITREVEFYGEDIPQIWQVFNSLTSPTVFASGSFYENESDRPDEVQFIVWPDGEYWDSTINGEAFGDSSVGITYYPTDLAVGATRVFGTHYGLSQFSSLADEESADLQATITAPAELLVNTSEDGYNNNPFIVNGWLVNNASSTAAENVTITLDLPDGLVAEGQPMSYSYDSIDAGANRAFTWSVTVLPHYVDTTLSYTVTLSADGMEDKVYEFTVDVPALPEICLHSNLSDWIVDTAATCTTAGSQHKECLDCGIVVENAEIPLADHTYELISSTPPSCLDTGLNVYKCSVCGDEYTEIVPQRHESNDGDIFCDFCGDPLSAMLELAIVLDTTGSMSDEISTIKRNMRNYIDELEESGIPYRLALVDYRDFADRGYSYDYEYNVILDFTNNTDDILAGIDSIGLGNGGDGPETVYSAVIDGLDELTWSELSARRIILIGDAQPLDPEPYTGYEYDDALESLDEKEIMVYAVATGGSSLSKFRNLADDTEGRYYECITDSQFNQVIIDIINDLPRGIHYHTFTQEVVEGNCTTGKKIVYTCTDCGKVVVHESDAPGHIYMSWQIIAEPTCDVNGTRTKECSVCGYTVTQAIPAIGHNYTEVIVDATCAAGGYTDHICETCGHNYHSDETPALPHTYMSWQITVEANCQTEGQRQKICSGCGYTVTQNTGLGDHIYMSWQVTTPATCATNGERVKECSVCAHTITQVIPATGHNYVETVVGATCGVDGYTNYTCTKCSHSYNTDIVPATGAHIYNAWRITVEATCETEGQRIKDCSVCGHTVTQSLSAIGHNYQAWEVVVEPTCEMNGTRAKECANCGNVVTQPIAPTGHLYTTSIVPPTETEQGYTLHTCVKCGSEYKDNFTDYDDYPKFIISDITTGDGKRVRLDVTLEDNPGISAFALGLDFNSDVLTFEGADFNEEFGGIAAVSEKVVWFSNTDVTYEGVIMTLIFVVAEEAEFGDYDINFTYNLGDITNRDEEDISFAVTGGTVTVVDHLEGDINNDSEINTKDLTRLSKCLSEAEGISVNEVALDVNNDGFVNNKDLVLLMRYISGESVVIH